MKRLVYLLLGAALPASLSAQVPGNPGFGTDFQTYDEAILRLIEPFQLLLACDGVVLFDPDAVPPEPPGFSDLSPALQNICRKPSNASSGGTLSGGFSDPFSTRTFLPFTIDTSRPTPQPPPDVPTEQAFVSFLPVRDGAEYLSGLYSGPDYWLRFGFEINDYRVSDTDFEVGQSGTGIRADVVFGHQLSNGSVFGVGLSAGKSDADATRNASLFSDTVTFSRAQSDVDATVASVRNFCDSLDRGSQDGTALEARAFYVGSLTAASSFQLFGSVRKSESETRNPLCIFRLGENFGDDRLFAGYLSAEPKETAIRFGASTEHRRNIGKTTVLLRAGVSAENRNIKGYTQTENPTNPSAPVQGLDSGLAYTIPLATTGLALEYEDRDIFTITTEIGVRFVWDIGTPRNPGAAWFDAAYQRAFGDLDNRIFASFAGDGRATPTRFTFQGNPVDRNLVTLSTGLDYFVSNAFKSSLFVSASFSDIAQSYRAGAALTWQF